MSNNNLPAVSFERLSEKMKPEHKAAVEAIIANEFLPKKQQLTDEELAEELGIVRKTLYNWRQRDDFIKYMAAVSDKRLDNARAVADAQLLKLIRGDSSNGVASIKALELFYKLNERLVNRSVITADIHASDQPRLTREELSQEIDKLNEIIE